MYLEVEKATDQKFEEAVEKYKEIRKDPRLAYYGNAMGVEIHDETLEEYDDYAFPLVEGFVIEGGNLDYVKALAVHPLASEALELIREAFSDYRFVLPAAIKESFYPEYMTADELAGALLDLADIFDGYEFMDQVESPEDALTEIKYNLLAGLGMQEYASFLKDVKEESKELAPRAETLRDKLREYTPELTDEIQPMVKIRFSQDSNIKEAEDAMLYERSINEGDKNYSDKNNKLKKVLDEDWTKNCITKNVDTIAFVNMMQAVKSGKLIDWKCPLCGGNAVLMSNEDVIVLWRQVQHR